MSDATADPRRELPSVSALLETDAVRALLARAPRSLVIDAVRQTVEAARRTIARPRAEREWAAAITETLTRAERPSLRPVLNATGIVLHTNLGRAPLADAAIEAIRAVASGFSNLEYDVERGERGSRYTHCAALLRELTGAEDAIVVNNCAAALVLALNTCAENRAAVVSRGELVEIGGSFRIPEIMAKSGAHLLEIGTTNRTHVQDYERALLSGEPIGAVVKVHRSNFALEGFVAEASVAELAPLAARHSVPIVHDLGSGLLVSLDAFGLRGEPTARDALRSGASIVLMSGDKLLGGPQAGIVVGSRDIIDAMRRNPLARSYRVDKLTLAALGATLSLYREPARALREIPVLAMLSASVGELRDRADRLSHTLQHSGSRPAIAVVESEAGVGGGAFPTARIPSIAVAIGGDATSLERRLRAGDPCVVSRVAEGSVLLDLRTIPPRSDDALGIAVRAALDASGDVP